MISRSTLGTHCRGYELVLVAVVMVFAALAILGTTQPWLAGYAWSERGLQTSYGNVSFAAAGGVLWVCAYRIFGRGLSKWFAPIVSTLGLVITAMPVVVLSTRVGLQDNKSVTHGLHEVVPQFGLILGLASGLGCVLFSLLLARCDSASQGTT